MHGVDQPRLKNQAEKLFAYATSRLRSLLFTVNSVVLSDNGRSSWRVPASTYQFALAITPVIDLLRGRYADHYHRLEFAIR